MRQRYSSAAGFTGTEIAIIIVIIIFILVMLSDCARQRGHFGSLGPAVPWDLSVTPATTTIAAGTPTTFTVTVTMSTEVPRSGTGVTVPVWIDEDDYFGDETMINPVNVVIPPGTKQGTATFVLNCTVNGILQYQNDVESPYHVHAEYDSYGLNLASDNSTVTCGGE